MMFDRKKWMHEYCEKYYQDNKKRLLKKQIKYQYLKRIENRKIVINHYSDGANCCACCGESQDEFLTLDHIKQNGAEHRRKKSNRSIWSVLVSEGLPTGHRILCWNCNCGSYYRSKNGICPHQKLTTTITGITS